MDKTQILDLVTGNADRILAVVGAFIAFFLRPGQPNATNMMLRAALFFRSIAPHLPGAFRAALAPIEEVRKELGLPPRAGLPLPAPPEAQ